MLSPMQTAKYIAICLAVVISGAVVLPGAAQASILGGLGAAAPSFFQIIGSWFAPLFESQPYNPVSENPQQTYCESFCQNHSLGSSMAATVCPEPNANGCCCEKSNCAKLGETIDDLSLTSCCDGLDDVFLESKSICIKKTGNEEGMPCTFDDQCASGLKCMNFRGSSYCVDISHQTAGAICTFDNDCVPGYVCNVGANDGWSECVLKSTGKEGASCVFDSDCVEGNKCLSLDSSDFTKKTCVNIKHQTAGAACNFDDDCAPGYVCKQDSSGGTAKCAVKLPCVKEGEAINVFNAQLECCFGLKSINNLSDTGIMSSNSNELNVCADCGDKICGEGENRYNCPEDCGSPPESSPAPTAGQASLSGVALMPGQCRTLTCLASSGGSRGAGSTVLMNCGDKATQVTCTNGSLSINNSVVCCDDATKK